MPFLKEAGEVPGREELEFFGVTIKVRKPRLATLLRSDTSDDVQVVGRMHSVSAARRPSGWDPRSRLRAEEVVVQVVRDEVDELQARPPAGRGRSLPAGPSTDRLRRTCSLAQSPDPREDVS